MKSILKSIKLSFMVLTIGIFTGYVQAQVYIMPIDKLGDGYLEYQENKIPVLESLSSGHVCLFDEQWCKKDTLSLLDSYTYDGGFDPDLKLLIIDTQLVLINKDLVSISNGFGRFKYVNQQVDNTVFKLVKYSKLDRLLAFKALPIFSYAVNDDVDSADTQLVLYDVNEEPSEDIITNLAGDVKVIRRIDIPNFFDTYLTPDEDGLVTVGLDGIMTKMHGSMLDMVAQSSGIIITSL